MIKLSELLKNIFYIMLIFTFAQPFIRNLRELYSKTVEPHTKVGYLEIGGLLTDSQTPLKQLKKLFSDPEIKAVLVKIESSGGISGTSQTIFHEIMEFKKEFPKQLVVFTENICTSGAYWVACAADHIIASPVSWVGSVGASIPFQFKLKGFINEHKIQYHATVAGKYKNAGDPFVDTTEEQNGMLQELCTQTYQEFCQSVASRRSKLSINNINEWANGRIFLGKKALDLGLVDALGSRSDAVAWIKEKALIDGKIEWIKIEQPTGLSRLFGASTPDEDSTSSLVTKVVDELCTRLSHHGGSITAMT
jgi:protease-4